MNPQNNNATKNNNAPQNEKKINKPQPIPNNLNITINTSVPGFQTLKYKPNMTIPDASKDDNSVMFNPLVKLNKNVINSVPENVRIKEFFNRGLFDSLINLHGMQRVPSLAEATYNGYVDHNIFVTLEELFPVNGLIYINKQPYRIGDVQWRKGDWRVAQKYIDLPQLDVNKIEDPFLFQALVRDEIISGEEQLSNLPDNIVFGPNYNIDQDPTAQGRPKTEEAKKEEQKLLMLEAPPPPPTVPQIMPPPVVPKIEAPPPKDVPQIMPPKDLPQIEAPPKKELLQIEAPPKKELLRIEAAPMPIVEEIEEPVVEEDNIPVPDPKLEKSGRSAEIVRNYFGSHKYYQMCNELYKNIGPDGRAFMSGIFRQTTEVNVKKDTKNLSNDAYKDTIKDLYVYDNSGQGHCFFCAVAQGINSNNFNNQNNFNNNKNKNITYNFTNGNNKTYGKGDNIFTTNVMRKISGVYINKDYDIISLTKGIPNVNSLNDKFENILQNNPTLIDEPDKYMENINNVFEGNKENEFLVYKPTNVNSIIDKSRPFSLIAKENVQNYIMSSRYWGDELSVHALIDQLQLYVIIIKRNPDGSFYIANPMFVSKKKDETNDEKEDETKDEKKEDDILQNKWEHFMFLFHNNDHFELISFKYIIHTKDRLPDNTLVTKKKLEEHSIFQRNGKVYPPFYIIYLIFANQYIMIEEEQQSLFLFYPRTFEILKKTFSYIYFKFSIEPESPSDAKTFFKYFLEYFGKQRSGIFKKTYPELDIIVSPTTKFQPKKMKSQKKGGNKINVTRKNRQTGGQALITPYRSSPNISTPYIQTVSQVIKKDPDRSNIAYYITIDMQLIKGKEPLTNQQLRGQKCGNKWNAVRKSFSELTGTKYVIPPVYENYASKEKDNEKEKEKDNESKN